MNVAIVFGNDHTNSVGVVQSLGQAGYRLICLLYGPKNDIVRSSKYVDCVISAKDPQECIEKIMAIEFSSQEKIPIIATCDMAALVLERNMSSLCGQFLFGYAANYTLEYLYKKENQVRMAKSVGFDVPNSWTLYDTKSVPEDVSFPCLIKPLVSCEGAKCDIRICWTPDELEKGLNSLKYTKTALLQQYIEHDYEISILGCALSSNKCIIPAVENKLSLYPKYVGLECLADIQPLEDGVIKRCVEKLIETIGYVGLFSIEMMHSKIDDKFYFTEINLRNDGAEYFVTKYGANLPLNHVEDLKGLPLTEQKYFCPGYYIWDMHHFLSLLHGNISLFRWLKEINLSNGFLLFSKEDKKPFFKQYTNWILSKLKIRKDESYS